MTIDEFFVEFSKLKGIYLPHILTILGRRTIRLTSSENTAYCPISAIICHTKGIPADNMWSISNGVIHLGLSYKDARFIVLGADAVFFDELGDYSNQQLLDIYNRFLTEVRSW